MASFSIVLPVMNERLRIKSALENLYPYKSHIIISDSGSTDESISYVRSNYPDIKTVSIPAPTATETPEWWSSLLSICSSEYVILASCSEYFQPTLVEKIIPLIDARSFDFLYIPRISLTGGTDTSPLYCSPKSFLPGNYLHHPFVCRAVRLSAINCSYIKPHDNFLSQRSSIRIYIKCPADSSWTITHNRERTSYATFQKHAKYAYVYASLFSFPRLPRVIIDSTLRLFLDTLRVLYAFAFHRLNLTIVGEYLLRIIMHIQVLFFALLHDLRFLSSISNVSR
jgi:glycosyltransferase involved in cell wall biosynthesis